MEDTVMKKFYLFPTLIFFLATLTSESMPSELNIRLHDFAKFFITVDGKVYNNNSNSYTISGLIMGNHFIKVYKVRNNKYGGFSSRLVFSGNIFIPNGKVVYSMIDKLNNYVILKEEPLYTGNGPSLIDENVNNYIYPMAPEDFNTLKIVISNNSFDNTKITIAKQAIATNYFTSRQVFEIMKLFSFESSKLDIAKFAYKNTIDKNNYYMVNGAFNFSSSIDELNDWIIYH